MLGSCQPFITSNAAELGQPHTGKGGAAVWGKGLRPARGGGGKAPLKPGEGLAESVGGVWGGGNHQGCWGFAVPPVVSL